MNNINKVVFIQSNSVRIIKLRCQLDIDIYYLIHVLFWNPKRNWLFNIHEILGFYESNKNMKWLKKKNLLMFFENLGLSLE